MDTGSRASKEKPRARGPNPGFKLGRVALVQNAHHSSDHCSDQADRLERNQQLAQNRTVRRAHIGAVRTALILIAVATVIAVGPIVAVTGAGDVLNLDLVGLDLHGERLGGGKLQNIPDHALIFNNLLAAEDRAYLMLTAGREAVLEASLPGSLVNRRGSQELLADEEGDCGSLRDIFLPLGLSPSR